jgi:2-desacetyl-2-hydroxyethyl bacteriochlorophyllide A dehydrogenase
MKAVILEELNSNLTVGEIELTPLQYGQVLVKNIVSGLCGAQLQEIAGLKGNANFLPHLMGHEGCGIVQEVGAGVNTVKVGDKVVMHWRKGDGIESPFPKYIYKDKAMSSGKVTTLSEYSIVSENRLTSVPHDTPDELCALLGCGITTALGVITNEANVKLGESILIIGAGGVGLNLIQGAKLVSAYPIYAMDINDDKEELCLSIGATNYININTAQITDQKFDVIVDTTGNPQAINNAISLLSGKGRLILVGQPKPDQDVIIPNANKMFDGAGKLIKATQGGMTSPTDDIPRYINLYKAGLLDISKIITHRFDIDNINEAFNILKSGKAGRIIININNK